MDEKFQALLSIAVIPQVVDIIVKDLLKKVKP